MFLIEIVIADALTLISGPILIESDILSTAISCDVIDAAPSVHSAIILELGLTHPRAPSIVNPSIS